MPLGLRWLDGLPLNLVDSYSSSRAWVIAGGRIFTLGSTALENVAPAGFLKHGREEYLVARDAFNGLPLWTVDCGPLVVGPMVCTYNFGPLATDGQRVYVYKKDRLVALVAESGQVAAEYPVKYMTERLLLAQGVLVAAGWKDKEQTKDAGHGVDYAHHWVVKTAEGAVEAFDAATGATKWSAPAAAQEIVAADGAVFMLLQSGNPPTGQQILAADLQTGRERWRIGPEKLRSDPAIHLNCAGSGVLVLAYVKAKVIAVHSAADGKLLWEINPAAPAGSPGILWTPMMDGLLWRDGKRYDPLTGQVKGLAPPKMEAKPCCPPVLTSRYLVDSRGSSFWDMAISKDHPEQYRYIGSHAVRGACIMGTTPANGMLYAGQNYCTCLPGQVPGFVAYGPCGQAPTQADFAKANPIEKGPAQIENRKSEIANPLDWPMYRHDAQRSGATKATLPPQLKLHWQTEVARPANGPLADAWRARLTSWLSAPVVAEGKVFVAAADLGQVVAIDAASGKVDWRATVGARVDSPPAIHGGQCVFGAHDGRVHALSTRDGSLAWRVSVAPWERRMVAFGQVESVWPAMGAVLVQDNVVYASAGRSTESDGGIAVRSLDAASGEHRWATSIGVGTYSENDVLTANDGKLSWHHVTIDPRTGALDGAGKRGPGGGLEALPDGSWTRIGNRRSGNRRFGRAAAEMFAWNETTLFGYECLVGWNSANRWCFAVPKSKTAGEGKIKPEEYAWRLIMPRDSQVEAMALCANGLVVAGRICDAKQEKSRGFLWVVSLDDGKKLAEYPLASPPAYDGLAVAGEQVCLSLEDGNAVCFGK